MSCYELTEATAGDLLRDLAKNRPDDTAFIFDGISYSWKETDDITDCIAANLLKLGIRRGSHIAYWSLNHIHLVFMMLAAMKTGVVFAAINYSYKQFELRNVLQGSDAAVLFLGENKRGSDYAAMTEAVRKDCPLLREVFQMADIVQEAENRARAGGLSADEKSALEEAKRSVDCHDVMSITFTSGTTKSPKPVMLSHYNVINNVRQIDARMALEKEDVLIAPLPLFHSSGLTGMLLHGVSAGIPTVVRRMFKAGEVLQDIERYRGSVLMAVPSMLELLADSPERTSHDISSLRVIQTSGAAISPERLLQVTRALGVEHLITGYGQTECSPIICAMPYEDSLEKAISSSGKPIDYIEVRIGDLNTDEPLPAGAVGEVQVRGFNTMVGYYKRPEEMAKKYTADGWLKTTDAGFLDEEGYFHFSRRISETIIRHGENISPAEIEFVVEKYCPDIVNVRVVGVEEELVQEEIACLVQTRETKIDPDGLRAHVKSMLASFKVPKYVFQIDEFPMTDTHKIDLQAVKQLVQKLVLQEKQRN